MTAEYVPFEEFRDGLPLNRFRVIVNPELAWPFVAQRVNAVPVAIAVVAIGIVLALAGHAITGALVVTAGIVFRRALRWQAPALLLQLASRIPAAYADATAQGVMEVRRIVD
ncbi:MAG: hypothetical protein OEU93_15255 [Rubrivivax sp.]|nr:hypothetical protein [Rubrivivax sp.]MDH5339131.1 hypothetical protein [Rubrivivax sp.]